MARVPLRIKFLLLLLPGVLTLTITTLVIVRQAVERQIHSEIFDDLRNSIVTFRAFQREREATFSRSAELLADLPTVKALMTTHDVATIQDASDATWRLSGSDLLTLADPTGKVMAIHTKVRDIAFAETKEAVARSLRLPENQQWWFLSGHLYEVFFQPIYFGRSNDNRLLGVVAVGYEINEQAAKDVSHIAGSQVTFLCGGSLVASTIDRSRLLDFVSKFRASPSQQGPSTSLPRHAGAGRISARGSDDHPSKPKPGLPGTPTDAARAPQDLAVQDLRLGGERFLASTVELTPSAEPSVQLNVLKSYDQAAARFQNLYRTIAALGIVACFGLGVIAFIAFRRYTRPLERLVAGVRALGRGDFAYPLDMRGRDELAEVTEAFIRMRDDLQQMQKQRLETERLATIGRMASSISHDLRHQLTPIVANAEFLSEHNLTPEQSAELYQEIGDAVGRMTELIDSLLEFGNVRARLSPTYGSIQQTMQRAIRSVQSHPNIDSVNITLLSESNREGWFDSKKLERAFYNLLLNACQAAAPGAGEVEIKIVDSPGGVEITIRDNGCGIPEHLRTKIFEPFASFGKENGTGLGLTIVEKLLSEHGGTVELLDPSPGRTTFKVVLQLYAGPETESQDDGLTGLENHISSRQGL